MRIAYPEGLTSPEVEMAEGGTMLDNKSKFADLKAMLDSSKENVKMDAMKRIINMVARGKDVSELFPQVVKNVAVKNLELKKLVYVYLVRYAEEQQDLALLSISTFQRALKDPNQLIRASALRVLSSIRVQMIAPVMMLALKDSVRDMSPYVRKVAAHAIPKLYALDPDLQAQLIECIDYLLADKRTLVLGSAVYAFEETCPDHLQLLHKHFGALCRALVDVDEWGQVVMIGLLTRYARTQFTSPSPASKKKKQSKLEEHKDRNRTSASPTSGTEDEEDQEDEEEEDEEEDKFITIKSEQPLDADHMLLIASAKPLLQSRNCAVVMAVAQLLYYIAPPAQLSLVPKALVRLLRGPNEVQHVVLMNIATICAARNNMVSEQVFAISKNLFEPFLKSFFVRASDTAHVKQLKLQVLTSLVTEANVQLVIRELQAYLQMPDLASHAIEAIGRCALQVESSAGTCLSCLITLISSPRDAVVCSAVVVLKRLLHGKDAPPSLLKRVVKLVDSVKAPAARACVLWLVGTHMEKVGHLAPDLLRKVAKHFADEDDCVKLQALSLAAKLWVTEQKTKCELLIKYVLQLARYDRSYDIRDRCRLIRNLLTNPKCNDSFPVAAILLAEKPVPTLLSNNSQFADREHYQLGTLSHLLNQPCVGYGSGLPDFPEVANEEGRAARKAAQPEMPQEQQGAGFDELAKEARPGKAKEPFYSDEEEEESGEGEEESDEEAEGEESSENEEEEEGSEDDEDEDEEESSSEVDEEDESEESEKEVKLDKKRVGANKVQSPKPNTPQSRAIATSSSSSAARVPIKEKEAENEKEKKVGKSEKQAPTDLELLLDLDFSSTKPISSSLSSTLPIVAKSSTNLSSNFTRALPQYVTDSYFILLNAINAQGLSVEGRFTRSPSLFSTSMVTLELRVENRSSQRSQSPPSHDGGGEVTMSGYDVRIEPKQLPGAPLTSGPVHLFELSPSKPAKLATVGIDFADSGRSSEWLVKWGGREYEIQIEAPPGEQIEPIELAGGEEEFERLRRSPKMAGMHQLKRKVVVREDFTPREHLFPLVNCKPVREMRWCYAAQTIAHKDLVLISLSETDVPNERTLVVNCENVTFASLLAKAIENAVMRPQL